MAFITPNGNVKLLTGVPINVDYENTLYFASRSAQYTYFASKVKTVGGVPCSYSDVSYQRYQKNSIKLQINADLIYDCNYMMFQNTNFGNRWFYAFITGIEYVANQVTRIDYAIDDIQTWLWDCELLPSYVERQHSLTDNLATSFTDEPFGEMETIVRNKYHFDDTAQGQYNYIYVVYLAKQPGLNNTNSVEFKVQSGVGSGLKVIGYPPTTTGLADLNALLNKYNTGVNTMTPADVLAILQVRRAVFGELELEPRSEFYGQYYNLMDDNQTLPVDMGYLTIDMSRNFQYYNGATTYTPKNKKLLQYPFAYLEVTDCRTQSQVFNPLYAKTGADSQGRFYHFNFHEYGCGGAVDPATMVVPIGYKTNLTNPQATPNIYTGDGTAQDYTMIYKGAIHCAWLSDTFQAWLAQNGGILPVAYDMLKQPVLDLVGTVATGGAGIMNLLDSTVGSIQKISMVSHQPNKVHGNYNADIQYSEGLRDFLFMEKQIPAELAERIDMFFQMYGYAEKNVVVPNISSRPKWNYVKTNGLNINATIPEDATNHIVSIFSNGIRFWKNPAEVGRYNLDNSPS